MNTHYSGLSKQRNYRRACHHRIVLVMLLLAIELCKVGEHASNILILVSVSISISNSTTMRRRGARLVF